MSFILFIRSLAHSLSFSLLKIYEYDEKIQKEIGVNIFLQLL